MPTETKKMPGEFVFRNYTPYNFFWLILSLIPFGALLVSLYIAIRTNISISLPVLFGISIFMCLIVYPIIFLCYFFLDNECITTFNAQKKEVIIQKFYGFPRRIPRATNIISFAEISEIFINTKKPVYLVPTSDLIYLKLQSGQKVLITCRDGASDDHPQTVKKIRSYLNTYRLGLI
ncbi:MAG: hypothetical protein HC908_01880 [Calothrix sp. SM1_7_51]|nr:hypothetical protein [Calothrix sp. SM1_7_51]